MLVLKDDLSIELFDIDQLEASIKAAIDAAIDGALSAGAVDVYRSSGPSRIAANVSYLFLRMGCAATTEELRSLICDELNIDERMHYAQSHQTNTGSDGVLPAVSPTTAPTDDQPD